MTLDEAKAKVLQLFTEIETAGVEVLIVSNNGQAPKLELTDSGSLAWMELGNWDWHPEWNKTTA